jgi:5-enolpyruvylshikimate-3-phosphate synthase
MDITLDFKSKRVQGTVTLPASKSISNRVLIVNALADSELPISFFNPLKSKPVFPPTDASI